MNERSKIKTLVHYVAYRCADRPSVLSAVKLNKVLWYADLAAYMQWGEPITRARYIKKDRGPVVSELMPVVQQLENEKKIAIRRMPTLGGYKDKVEYLALTRPDVNNILNAEEITLIEDVIQNVCHKHTGKSISEHSHDAIWRLAKQDEDIPFHAMLTSKLHAVTPNDVAWAKEQVGA